MHKFIPIWLFLLKTLIKLGFFSNRIIDTIDTIQFEWERIASWEGMEMLKIFEYRRKAVGHFTGKTWMSQTVYCIRCVMICKIGFTNRIAKIALLRASMVVTYYNVLFRTGAERYNGILMSLQLLVAETISKFFYWFCLFYWMKWILLPSDIHLTFRRWWC